MTRPLGASLTILLLALLGLGLARSRGAPPPNPFQVDTDRDGLSDGREAQLGTDPNKRDTDGDGYSDGQEVNDPRLNNPTFDRATRGARRADPLVRDVFVEIDYLGPKKAWFVKYHGHKPEKGAIDRLLKAFERKGYQAFVQIDDKISHKGKGKLTRAEIFDLKQRYQDTPIYYHALFADRGEGPLPGKSGVAWFDTNNLVVFDRVWYLNSPGQGALALHELGHLLVDTSARNPRAGHLRDKGSDGKHCPYDCALNRGSGLSFGKKIGQWRKPNFDSRCWNAVRGFYAR